MQHKPELNVSGFRGIWGDTLTEEIARGLSRAFGLFAKEDTGKDSPTILIGRDGRESGPAIKEAIINELRGMGIKVVDGDILPTPTVLFAIREHGYDGAVIITASHNPREYNGLKFINRAGLFPDQKQIEKIKQHYGNS